MKKKEKLEYTAPLTAVEEFSKDVSVDSAHEALQTIWEINEQSDCEQEKDTQ